MEIEPNQVVWPDLEVKESGDYDLLLELRHSERSAQETELTRHYQLLFDERPLDWKWEQLNTWHTGNGYFGRVRIPLGNLSAGDHRFCLTTTKTWCAVSLPIRLVPAPDAP